MTLMQLAFLMTSMQCFNALNIILITACKVIYLYSIISAGLLIKNLINNPSFMYFVVK